MLDLFRIIFNPATLALMIPVIAVGSSMYYVIRKQELKAKIKANLSSEEKQMVRRLVQNNQELNERMANLESIITSLDKDLLALKASNETDENKQKVKEISQRLKPE